MPYHIVKTVEGYFVENKDTGKRYSQRPMTKANAAAQLRVLQQAEGGEGGKKKRK